MTWRWWVFAVALGLAVELLARTRFAVWADRIAFTLLWAAAARMVARRFREPS